MVRPGTYSGFGWTGPRIDRWLDDLFASPRGANKLGKLSRARAVQRHLVSRERVDLCQGSWTVARGCWSGRCAALIVVEGFGWCAVSEGGMKPLPVVVDLDVFGDREAGTGSGIESLAVVHLVLQGGEEGFRRGVVPADPGPADAGTDTVRHTELGEFTGRYWQPRSEWKTAPAVRWPCVIAICAASVTRLVRRCVGQLPADDHAGAQVEHGGQVQPPLAGLQLGDR